MTLSKFASNLTLLRLIGEDGTFNNYIVLWPVVRQCNSSRCVERGSNKNVKGTAGAFTPPISLPDANQPPVPLRMRRTIGLCQLHETLGYIFSTNNANGYKTYIMYQRLLYPCFPQHPSAAAFHPRKWTQKPWCRERHSGVADTWVGSLVNGDHMSVTTSAPGERIHTWNEECFKAKTRWCSAQCLWKMINNYQWNPQAPSFRKVTKEWLVDKRKSTLP